MPTVKKPQDHKAKVAKSTDFTFEHEGATYILPHPSGALESLPGRAYRDAVMEGAAGEQRLAFTCLEIVTDAATLDVLYSKPAGEMGRIVAEWFDKAAEDGATAPQS